MEQNLLHKSFQSPIGSGNSFTALLELPTNQVMKLLHEPDSNETASDPSSDVWRNCEFHQKSSLFSFNCYPTFPTNTDLLVHASKFSVFPSGEDSPQTTSMPSISDENLFKIKKEVTGVHCTPDVSPILSVPMVQTDKKQLVKRKEEERDQIKMTSKKNKSSENEREKTREQKPGGEKLPYVHVRARRGQATDSHSLAERARREKINSRMKLLQELVPGCSKISGTALVLEEIINHVQSLQRQVEFLSMKLAAANPRMDFNPNCFFPSEDAHPTAATITPSTRTEISPCNGPRMRYQHENHMQVELLHQQMQKACEGNDNHLLVQSGTSPFIYHFTDSGLSPHQNHLKTKL